MLLKGLELMIDPACLVQNWELAWKNKAFDQISSPEIEQALINELMDVLWSKNTEQPFHDEVDLTATGSLLHAKLSVTPIYEGFEQSVLFVLNITHGMKIKALEKEARTDSLTGVNNKLGFNEGLSAKHRKATTKHSPLTLVYLDLDKFKPINDTYGHKAGDLVLEDFAKNLKAHVRSDDIIGRLGGDEFALVLESDEASAMKVIERLMERERLYFEGHLLDYGFSFGIAELNDDEDLDCLLARADKSMYDHKKNKTAKDVFEHNRYLSKTLGKKGKTKMPFPLTLPFIKQNTLDNIQNTEILPSKLHGYGLFATQDIPVQTRLCKLNGQLIPKTEYQDLVKRLTPQLGALSFYFLMECNHVPNPNLYMVRSFRTKWSYVNHSPEPNCFFDIYEQVLHPLRDIKKGEELTFDYRVEPLSEDYVNQNKEWLEGME